MPICQQTLEQSAEDIGNAATSGQFLDPNENPSAILQSMREVRSRKKKKRKKKTLSRKKPGTDYSGQLSVQVKSA